MKKNDNNNNKKKNNKKQFSKGTHTCMVNIDKIKYNKLKLYDSMGKHIVFDIVLKFMYGI